MSGANTHYGVIVFMGDPDGDHPDEMLRGSGPWIQLCAAGCEEFCIETMAEETLNHPLRRGERVEILARDGAVIDFDQDEPHWVCIAQPG